MESKIMQVFYGNDCLPYKDQARTVHFPVVGNTFQGANNTTEIRFYYSQIGGNDVTWVAISKLPSGKVGSKVLQTYYDGSNGEYYAKLPLDSFYTQYRGDVFISLQGYEGGVNVNYDEDSGIYTITGTPTIRATGSINLTVNYASSFVGSGEEQNVTLQEIFAYLSTKMNNLDGFIVIANTSVDTTGYEDGQVFYSIGSQSFYRKVSGILTPFDIGYIHYGDIDISGYDLTADNIYLGNDEGSITTNEDGITYTSANGILFVSNTHNYKLSGENSWENIATQTWVNANYLMIGDIDLGEHYIRAEHYEISSDDYQISVDNDDLVIETNVGDILLNPHGKLYYGANEVADKSWVGGNYANDLTVSLNSSTFVITFTLKNSNGATLKTQSIDLPLESVVVDGEYDEEDKEIVLTLQNGSTVNIPLGDLVDGLATAEQVAAIAPVFKVEDNTNASISIAFENNTDKKVTNSVATTSVNLVIPSTISQGFQGTATILLGSSVPTFALTNNSAYNVYYLLDGKQIALSEWQETLSGNSTLELMVECNGFNIRVYGKSTTN